MRQTIQQILFDAVTPVAIVSSTDATPIVVTATAHGFQTGDRVLIFGHTTNVAANGISKVTRIDADTFSLQGEILGGSTVGSGAGAGAGGIAMIAPPVVLVSDFKSIEIQIGTGGTATTTIKAAGSIGRLQNAANYAPGGRKDFTNMGATVTPTNPYSFIQMIDLSSGASIQGATGVVVAGTDIQKMFEVNTNGMKYFTLIPVSWTAGAITAKLMAFYE